MSSLRPLTGPGRGFYYLTGAIPKVRGTQGLQGILRGSVHMYYAMTLPNPAAVHWIFFTILVPVESLTEKINESVAVDTS